MPLSIDDRVYRSIEAMSVGVVLDGTTSGQTAQTKTPNMIFSQFGVFNQSLFV